MKASVATGAFLVAATTMRVAVTAGIDLAQVGEFSFILGRSGLEVGLINPSQWQLLLAASIATMVVTPALLGVAPRIGSWMASKATPAHSDEAGPESAHLSDHVVILGFGMGGQLLGRALRQLATPYVILDLNGATVMQGRKDGESIFFGDATNEDALRAAGVDRAKAVVGVLSDPYAAARALTAIRTINDSVPIILRMRYKTEAEAAMLQGATVAVAEEMEASLEVVAQTIARLDVPGNVIDVLLDSYRRESMGMRTVRAPASAAREPAERHQQDTDRDACALRRGLGGWTDAGGGEPPCGYRGAGDRGSAGRTLHNVAAGRSEAGGGRRVVPARRRQRHHTRPPSPERGRRGEIVVFSAGRGTSRRTAAANRPCRSDAPRPVPPPPVKLTGRCRAVSPC